MHSRVAGSEMPAKTTADAPKKRPAESLDIAATEPCLLPLPTAASTFSFVSPVGGGIQLVGRGIELPSASF